MTVKQRQNPERLMLLLFPLITLSLFILAILLIYYVFPFVSHLFSHT